MRKHKRLIFAVLIILIFAALNCTVVFAEVTESQVQQAVDSSSKEAVTGNVFVWFLCAVGFLKVAQKIDSFMSSLGISVGQTGGSMLSEAMVVMKSISSIQKMRGKGGGSGNAVSGNGSSGGIFSGGLAGIAGRHFTQNTISGVTNQGGDPISRQTFQSSLAKGGTFANNIIGKVAAGNISTMGSITGKTASQAAVSYLGYTGKADAPRFSDVEIGGGRIMGKEISAANPEGIPFGMYRADQYMEPHAGKFDIVDSADGAKWYRQYAENAVEKIPYTNVDGKVEYYENIVQKLPDMPKRKDRV